MEAMKAEFVSEQELAYSQPLLVKFSVSFLHDFEHNSIWRKIMDNSLLNKMRLLLKVRQGK